MPDEPKQPHKVWTYDDLPTLVDDGRRFEILDGELFVSPSPTVWHQEIAKRLFLVLYQQLEGKRLAKVYFAPLDVILSPTRVVVPDLLVVRKDRYDVIHEKGVMGAPDLVVEVVSPSNTKHDRLRKRRFYARVGVREYWIVDPESTTIDVLELIDGGLSYRPAGWFGPGDRARSVGFEVEVEIDVLFREDE